MRRGIFALTYLLLFSGTPISFMGRRRGRLSATTFCSLATRLGLRTPKAVRGFGRRLNPDYWRQRPSRPPEEDTAENNWKLIAFCSPRDLGNRRATGQRVSVGAFRHG